MTVVVAAKLSTVLNRIKSTYWVCCRCCCRLSRMFNACALRSSSFIVFVDTRDGDDDETVRCSLFSCCVSLSLRAHTCGCRSCSRIAANHHHHMSDAIVCSTILYTYMCSMAGPRWRRCLFIVNLIIFKTRFFSLCCVCFVAVSFSCLVFSSLLSIH